LRRKGERDYVAAIFRDHFKVDLRVIDAERALPRQAGRGHRPGAQAQDHRLRVHRVFEEQAKAIDNAKFLAQGTLYPDVIESVSLKGPSR
jgi:GMP synthase (glutamine-hydrolysing)